MTGIDLSPPPSVASSSSLRPRLPWPTWVCAGSVFLLLLAVSSRYGFHRDELYFITAGRHLEWGYVDQPPLTPAIAGVVDLWPGQITPTALRLIPAMSASAVVLLTGLLARRFGGQRIAVTSASVFAAISGFFLAVGHLLSTTTFDVLIWLGVALLLAAMIDGVSPRWWLGIGVLLGFGILNKYTVVSLVVALAIGLLLTPQRRLLLNPWPWVSAVVALLIAAPNLIWQATNGWPQLQMAAALRSDSDGPVDYFLLQIAILSVFLIIPAAAGWWWLLADEVGREWRVFPIAFVVLFLVFLATGARGYYVAPLYLPLLAAGAVWLEGTRLRARILVFGMIGAGAIAGLFLALPLVPPSQVGPFNEVNNELGETYGWEQLTDQVEAVYQQLSPEERADAVIFAANYGEASAMEVLATDRLPPVVSGHNNHWLWGPGDRQGPIIGIGPVGSELSTICPDLVVVSEVSFSADVDNEENGATIWLCRDPDTPLATIWSELKHFN